MAAQKGLSMLLKLSADGSGGTVAGLQVTTMSIGNQIVDVTNKDSAGWRTLLAGAGVQSITLTANGTAVNDATFATLQSNAQTNAIAAYQMIYGNGDTISGNFQISKFDISGAYNKEQTFVCTLESSGQPTFVNI